MPKLSQILRGFGLTIASESWLLARPLPLIHAAVRCGLRQTLLAAKILLLLLEKDSKNTKGEKKVARCAGSLWTNETKRASTLSGDGIRLETPVAATISQPGAKQRWGDDPGDA